MGVTVKDLMRLDPCEDYPEGRVKELCDGRDELSFEEIAQLDIPIDDIVWVLTELMTEPQQRFFARKCASDVLHQWEAPDIVKKYLETGDESIMEDARSAALSAARSAAMSASRSAAWSAAMSAAWPYARSAAWSYVWSAANEAVWSYDDDSIDKAYKKYVSWAIEILESRCENIQE
jgi:hypothetical protein